MRALFPVLSENTFFTVLANPDSLYPGFLARDFVALPPGSYAMAPAALQLLGQNLITLELPGVDPTAPGYAGMAKGANQIELLDSYRGKGGQPFGKVPIENYRHAEGEISFTLPPQASGWLVTTTSYHPDWVVTLDGKPAEKKCAESALLSVHVPTGTHDVTFRFEAPAWYSLCLRLGMLAWICGLGVFFYFGSSKAPESLRLAWSKA
jgi:Bacterial membrane protein YfhO